MEWLSDVGGLIYGLGMLAGFFVVPIAKSALESELLSQIFKSKSKHENENSTPGSPAQ